MQSNSTNPINRPTRPRRCEPHLPRRVERSASADGPSRSGTRVLTRHDPQQSGPVPRERGRVVRHGRSTRLGRCVRPLAELGPVLLDKAGPDGRAERAVARGQAGGRRGVRDRYAREHPRPEPDFRGGEVRACGAGAARTFRGRASGAPSRARARALRERISHLQGPPRRLPRLRRGVRRRRRARHLRRLRRGWAPRRPARAPAVAGRRAGAPAAASSAAGTRACTKPTSRTGINRT